MRAFIAIEISDEIKEALGRVEAHLKYAGADVKWVRPENIHLTLKFLGEISEEKTAEVKAVLDLIAGSTVPFEVTIKDVGAFPNIEGPRVIWVDLEKGVAQVIALAGAIDEALAKIGFTKDNRPFSPHLTIGRVRSSHNKSKLADKVSSTTSNSDLADVSAHQIKSVILFRSTLTPQGPIYTKLHEAQFRQ